MVVVQLPRTPDFVAHSLNELLPHAEAATYTVAPHGVGKMLVTYTGIVQIDGFGKTTAAFWTEANVNTCIIIIFACVDVDI